MISSILYATGVFISIMIFLYIFTGVAIVLLPILNIAVILILVGIVILATFCLFVYPTRIYSKKKGFGIFFIIYTLIQCINVFIVIFNINIIPDISIILSLLLLFGTIPFIIISLLLYYNGEELFLAFLGMTAIHVIPIFGIPGVIHELSIFIGGL